MNSEILEWSNSIASLLAESEHNTYMAQDPFSDPFDIEVRICSEQKQKHFLNDMLVPSPRSFQEECRLAQELEAPFPVEMYLANTTCEQTKTEMEGALPSNNKITQSVPAMLGQLSLQLLEYDQEEHHDKDLTENSKEEDDEDLEEDKEEEQQSTRYVNGLPIKLTKMRGDVALKTILRYMRKFYLEEFKNHTHYVSYNRRNKNKRYLEDCLKSYSEAMLASANLQNQNDCPDLEELIFFLGSIFYPKIMKKQHRTQQKRIQIDGYHKALYQFSASKLKALNEVPSYRFLVLRFINSQKEDLLANHKTFVKARDDYLEAFNYIAKFASY